MSEPAGRSVLVDAASGAVLADHLHVASSFWARFRGLMGRSSLGAGEGLYLRTASIHMFFMRFPIDALFVARADPDGTRSVVGVHPSLPPWRGLVLPVRGAEGVVELPAGTLARTGVAVGDRVRLDAQAGVRA
ncbi:MAG: DUF192 domain-containing protein [Chloroflexi bacterium]|nr:DUF192 domain-containing protein [Chloroflexota bacterium]HEV8053307.1 DUF192 domain-containing protein [Candidatus Limnocylindrales bacterium]